MTFPSPENGGGFLLTKQNWLMSVSAAVIIYLDFAIKICYIIREQQSSKGDLSKTVMFFAGVFSF
nr:MAG TPA: hypothetical protein [Caudoviricetes sp.]